MEIRRYKMVTLIKEPKPAISRQAGRKQITSNKDVNCWALPDVIYVMQNKVFLPVFFFYYFIWSPNDCSCFYDLYKIKKT